jgi:cell division septum initiation protein DivIVA
MSELTERFNIIKTYTKGNEFNVQNLIDSCANECEQLTQENKRLREALEDIHERSFKKRYWDIRDITSEALEETK